MSAERTRLTPAQVALMAEVLAETPSPVKEAADRVGRGSVVPDDDAEAVVKALAAVMLSSGGYDVQGLTTRGQAIDAIIGVVQQMSEHFYD